MEGTDELKRDILVKYKGKKANLKAHPRVRFEDEEGAGSGPVRQFLLTAMNIVDEGIGNTFKPVIYFEGEKVHRLPLHDQSLRITGAFKGEWSPYWALCFTRWPSFAWSFARHQILLIKPVCRFVQEPPAHIYGRYSRH